MYDKNNVFAKMIRGEIPCRKIYENDHAMSFYDIAPAADVHALVIPKGAYQNILEFMRDATVLEQNAFWDCFVQTSKMLGVNSDFNVIANAGAAAPLVKQTVFHFHMHILAGKKIKEL